MLFVVTYTATGSTQCGENIIEQTSNRKYVFGSIIEGDQHIERQLKDKRWYISNVQFFRVESEPFAIYADDTLKQPGTQVTKCHCDECD